MPPWLEPEVIKKQINKHGKFAYWKAVSFRPASAHFQLDGEPSFLGKPPDSGPINQPERTHWQLSCNDIARVSHKQMLTYWRGTHRVHTGVSRGVSIGLKTGAGLAASKLKWTK